MRLYPYDRFILPSPLPPETVRERLEANVESRNYFRFWISIGFWSWTPKHRDFEGEVSSDTFKVRRIPGYANSWIPEGVGVVMAQGRGSSIQVTTRLSKYFLALVAIFWAFFSFGVFAPRSAFATMDALGKVGIALGVTIAVYAVVLLLFFYEAIQLRKMLAQLFEATIEAA